MRFGGEKQAKLMESAIGICSWVVRMTQSDEKCYTYMQSGGEEEAQLMKTAIGI